MMRFLVFFSAVLFSSTIIISGADAQNQPFEPTCDSSEAIQNWLTNPNLAGRAKFNATINDVSNFLPKLDKLCNQSPTLDTIYYGGATKWLEKADAVAASLSEIVFNAFMSEKSNEHHRHKLNELLALESYRLQLRLNEIRSMAYNSNSVARGLASGHCKYDNRQCLSINVNPWAIVRWEDKEVEADGVNPLVVSGLTPGNYVFTFDHPLFEPLELNITIMEEKQSIYVDLLQDASTKNKLGER